MYLEMRLNYSDLLPSGQEKKLKDLNLQTDFKPMVGYFSDLCMKVYFISPDGSVFELRDREVMTKAEANKQRKIF